jgi:hypothetical protein
LVEAGARLDPKGTERVIRSDSGVAHRLSLSARFLSAVNTQVKVKRRERSASGACRIGLRASCAVGQNQAAIGGVTAPFWFYPGNIRALKVYLPFPAQ